MQNAPIHYKCIKIAGPDAKKFLQGQLTCDMDKITPEVEQLAAHCNPQGRVISLFKIFLHLNDYYLLMPEEMAPITLAALKKYAVFFKVTLELADPPAVIVNTILDFNIYPKTSGTFLPHELNLDKLNALSFDKGCYTGQEIIARMQYRGKLKNRLFQATLATAAQPIPGADIYCDDDQVVGTVVDSRQQCIYLVCEEIHVKNDHLFIVTKESGQRIYLTFSTQVTHV